MQASDYTSAARSLAQPLSSRSSSPSPNRTSPIPPRTRRSASPDQSRRNRRTSWQRINPEPPRASRCAHRATQLLVEGQKLRRHGMKQFKKLARWQQIGAILLSAILLLCSILFLVFNERIFAWLVPFAKGWRAMTAGWVISFIFTFICAFPPVIGYSMSLTVAGFVFGFPRGWFIAASASIVGSFCSFLLCRYWLSSFTRRLVATDKRFEALAHTLKRDGFKLLIMIRLCPLPYSLSNGAMATVPTISPLTFAAATAAATPKLLVHIFIGGRLASIAENGGKMDSVTKLINYASIITGVLLGAGTGYVIYNRVVKRAAEIETEEHASNSSANLTLARAMGSRYSERSLATLADDEENNNVAQDEATCKDTTNASAHHTYSDDLSDDETNVFAQGDGDEEQS